MEYKRTYTEAEVKELQEWFNSNDYEKEIDLGKGIHILDTRLFVENTMNVITKNYENATYSGMIYKLQMLRDALIEQGKVKKSE